MSAFAHHPLPWLGTPVPDTLAWATRCRDHLIALDPKLDPDEAQALADDMATRTHWRAMEPEAAAAWLFRPIEPRQAW